MKKYNEYIDQLKFSTHAKIKNFTENEIKIFCEMLQQFEEYAECITSNNSEHIKYLDLFHFIGLNAITRFFSESCIPFLSSIQPIKEQKSIVKKETKEISMEADINILYDEKETDSIEYPYILDRTSEPSLSIFEVINLISDRLRINHDLKVIKEIAKNAKDIVTWDIYQHNIPHSLTDIEKIQTLKLAFKEAEQNIKNNTGAERIDNYMAGCHAFNAIKGLDGFKDMDIYFSDSSYIAGTLDGKPVIRVPTTIDDEEFKGAIGVGRDQILCHSRMNKMLDIGSIWSPFITLCITSNILPMSTNLIKPGILASWTDFKIIDPGYATMINIEDLFHGIL